MHAQFYEEKDEDSIENIKDELTWRVLKMETLIYPFATLKCEKDEKKDER